ncbi:MAG: tetratricopeptide repeat protein [Bradymonadaceae bacterium]
MTKRRHLFWSLGGVGCMALAIVVSTSELAAQFFEERPPVAGTQPLAQLNPAAIQQTLHLGAALHLAGTHLHASTKRAQSAALCSVGEGTLLAARESAYWSQMERTETMLRALISDEAPCGTENEGADASHLRNRARLHLGRLLTDAERYEEALTALDSIEGKTPVDDYVLWIKGNAHEGAGSFSEAADLYKSIVDLRTSPLHWRARARQAKSLAQAERWTDALPVLTQIVETFPDYPRRHRALYYRGQTLEALGRLPQAAEAYQQTWFEFPFKKEGELATDALKRLEGQGIVPTPIAATVLFRRYQQLRVDKHWPLVHRLLTELREAHATEDGNSPFENEILLEIGINAFHSHNYTDAIHHLSELRKIYEAGHTGGVSPRTMYRHLSLSYGQLGRHDEAIAALDARDRTAGVTARQEAIASYYESHGQYARALEIYDKLYSAPRKRGWHFSYLLYKAGRFEQAYENLTELAERSRGERRAKYLYWSGRTLERSGNDDEAAAIFGEVARVYTTSYYGHQANGRLIDIASRRSVSGPVMAQAGPLVRSTESALDAMEDAAHMLATRRLIAPADPRMKPLENDLVAALSQDRGATPANCLYQGPVRAEACRAADLDLKSANSLPRWTTPSPVANAVLQVAANPITSARDNDDEDRDEVAELDAHRVEDARIPRRPARFGARPGRVRYTTDARIYWNGRHDSDVAFVRWQQGEMLGPAPKEFKAYDTDDYVGGLSRAAQAYGNLFPELIRAQWLWEAGMSSEARRAIRDVSLEYRGLIASGRPGAQPHELSHDRWAYFIDNRRSKSGLWGMQSDEKRFPVPTAPAARKALLERQQTIVERRAELEPVLLHAFQEAGDYHLVRRHALSRGGWTRQDPAGPNRDLWMMAYPRAFPELVIPAAIKHNINPYIIWALMLVESSFNPDSLSRADAMGLLQVIPRTGWKISALFGDEDFGPFDLLDEENSISQGIFYLGRLIEKFHGQELFAFAGYNGGPHRISAWLDIRGHDIPLDEFIEEIPFNESRGYAKKVLRFLGVYMRIYEGTDRIYVGQNVRRDYLEQPDF